MQYIFKSKDITINESIIRGGVTIAENINPQTNMTIGNCACTKLELEILDLKMQFNAGALQDVEFEFGLPELSPYQFLNGDFLVFGNNTVYGFDVGGMTILGYFTVAEAVRIDDTKYKLTLYDRMKKFEVDVSDWFNALKFPITLKGLYISLCAKIGVNYESQTFTNENYVIQKSANVEGVTGRDVLAWIAEAAGAWAQFNNTGKLQLKFYTQTDRVIERKEKMFGSAFVADYEVKSIDKLQIKATENDIGVIVGTGNNMYVIQNNPLFFANSDSVLRPAATALYNKLSLIRYTPFELTYDNRQVDVNVGDIIKISVRRGLFSVVVMEKVTNGIKSTIKCTGEQTRNNKKTPITKVIKQIGGKIAEIVFNIEEFSSTFKDFQNNTESQFKQTADSIATKVSQGNYDSEKPVSSPTAPINPSKGKMWFDTTTNQYKQWNGSAWVIATDQALTGRVAQTESKVTQTANDVTFGFTRIGVDGNRYGPRTGYTVVDVNGLTVYDGRFSVLSQYPSNQADYEASFGSGGIIFQDKTHGGSINIGLVAYNPSSYFGSYQYLRSTHPLTIGGSGTYLGSEYCEWRIGENGFRYLGGNNNFTCVNLASTGSKNALVETNTFGKRLINAYETAEYYFGDIGEAQLTDPVNGCRVDLDPVFLETVNTEDVPYQVFITPYNGGQIYVAERHPAYFIVRGNVMSFAWEVKAKRRDFETMRLEEVVDGESTIKSRDVMQTVYYDPDFTYDESQENNLDISPFDMEMHKRAEYMRWVKQKRRGINAEQYKQIEV